MNSKLIRPLNSLLILLRTDKGEGYFLLDTGCPYSFAVHAQFITAGDWLEDAPVKLRPAPFSLDSLSERLGVPIEGFIGRRELLNREAIYFDYDEERIYFGDHARHVAQELTQHGPSPQTLSLTEMIGAPLGVMTTLDPDEITKQDADPTLSPRPFFLDTGSRFIIVPKESPITRRRAVNPIYHLDLHTPRGNMRSEVSADHFVQHTYSTQHTRTIPAQPRTISPLCVATGLPAGYPLIIGSEWLSTHNTLIDFTASLLKQWPRAIERRPTWEVLSSDIHAPLIELYFDPLEHHQANRTFTVMPRAGQRLPEGLLPMTKYRISGFQSSSGVEGINEIFSMIFSSDSKPKALVVVNESGVEVNLPRSRLFQTEKIK